MGWESSGVVGFDLGHATKAISLSTEVIKIFFKWKKKKLCENKKLIVSTGYGFDFVTPMPPPPPQCVERFHRYRSNEKNIIASLLKFAGYIHSHKILTGNIFGLILKNKMAATGVS